MITLGYIRGINRNDTPYFSNKEEQEKYFENAKLIDIDTSYYPPHYNNEIMLSNEDVDFSSKINYCWLSFEGKIYYYFIDRIEYINNGLIKILITMDTIQTYMFDIVWNNSSVIRRSIKRWTDDNKINRNYIRENLSNGTFINESYEEDSSTCKLIIIHTTEQLQPKTIDNTPSLTDKGFITCDGQKVYNGEVIYVLPYLSKKKDIIITRIYGNDRKEFSLYYSVYINTLKNLCSSPKVSSISLSNYNLFKNLSITETKDSYNVSFNSDILNAVEKGYYELIQWTEGTEETKTTNGFLIGIPTSDGLSEGAPVIVNDGNYTSRIGYYRKSTKLGMMFSPRYVPQLLDENYIKLTYGERLGYTSYPLHLAREDEFTFGLKVDYFTGERTYFIKNGTELDDIHLTSITNKTLENFTLYNDALKEYLAQNKGTLTSGVALAQQKAIFSGVSGALGGGVASIGGNALGGKIGALGGAIGGAMSVAKAIEGNYVFNEQLKITKENAEFTPDTIKQGNSFSGDIINHSTLRIRKIDKVNDYENVGRKLERFGYLVNETYFSDNLFNTLNTRYYYNVIQCSDLSIDLSILSSEMDKQNIIDRFKIGLRLWNVEHKIGIGSGYYYVDNVENDYIGG